MTDVQRKALMLKEDIEKACLRRGLNLTIHDGKIGFVEQQEKKIVMLWDPIYTVPNDPD